MRSLWIASLLLLACNQDGIPIGDSGIPSVDGAVDLESAGGCNPACLAAAHATVACVAHQCTIAACDVGYADCDRLEADGCEVRLLSDAMNCGACGNVCLAGSPCIQGQCTCKTGVECSGACVDLQTDPNNCGACGHACMLANASAVCINGVCVIAGCDFGFADCDKLYSNGCEVAVINDVQNCGGCAIVCGQGFICSGGQCVCPLSRCGSACVDLRTDANNCGACGNVCPNGSLCLMGVCGRCPTGQSDCGGSCTDTTTDVDNCGACGNVCPMGDACFNGQCINQCPACLNACCPLTICGGKCVSLICDPNNCGACGVVCAMGTTCCPGGTCSDLQNDRLNCGTCGLVCPIGESCLGGLCSVTFAPDCGVPAGDGGTCEPIGAACSQSCECCSNTCVLGICRPFL
jgi:hypothetical protein